MGASDAVNLPRRRPLDGVEGTGVPPGDYLER